jgi:hypothetical protein
MATIVGMRVSMMSANYVFGDTYELGFPNGQYDPELDRDVRDEFRKIIPKQRP